MGLHYISDKCKICSKKIENKFIIVCDAPWPLPPPSLIKTEQSADPPILPSLLRVLPSVEPAAENRKSKTYQADYPAESIPQRVPPRIMQFWVKWLQPPSEIPRKDLQGSSKRCKRSRCAPSKHQENTSEPSQLRHIMRLCECAVRWGYHSRLRKRSKGISPRFGIKPSAERESVPLRCWFPLLFTDAPWFSNTRQAWKQFWPAQCATDINSRRS